MQLAPVQETSFKAIVRAEDGVRFAAGSDRAEQLMSQLVNYVRERCDDVLWPSAARQVRALIEAGQPHAAVALYFIEVGDRWDEERLELHGLDLVERRGSGR
jgi:hypothetical protein